MKLATWMLEAASEADKQAHSSKIETMHEDWSKNDAKEKHIKCKTECCILWPMRKGFIIIN